MTREQIEAEWLVWRETGKMHDAMFDFAQHIAKIEREECAKVCLEMIQKKNDVFVDCERTFGIIDCVNVIRARGDE